MQNVPKTDTDAHAAIRAIGHGRDMTETMLALFDVRRAQGDDVLTAYKGVLVCSLSDESIRALAPKVPDAAAEMARREGR